jgi:hypothetical protein
MKEIVIKDNDGIEYKIKIKKVTWRIAKVLQIEGAKHDFENPDEILEFTEKLLQEFVEKVTIKEGNSHIQVEDILELPYEVAIQLIRRITDFFLQPAKKTSSEQRS